MAQEDAYNAIPQNPLTVRWRIANGALPLAHRHINALVQRGAGATLQAWVHSRVEQLLSGKVEYPDGVIMVDIDPAGEVLVNIEARPKAVPPEETAMLVDASGNVIDCSGASVWIRVGEDVLTPPTPGARERGTRTFVRDLAKTMQYNVIESPLSADQIAAADEHFLISDVFGVLLVEERGGELSGKLATAFDRLWS